MEKQKEELVEFREKALAELESITTQEALERWRIGNLSRKGKVQLFTKAIKNVPQQDRPAFGALVNSIKQELFKAYQHKQKMLTKRKEEAFFDDALPGRLFPRGRLHPLTKIIREIEEIFLRLGFDVEEGPELEKEYYNFDGLNIPPDHPARDEWDSFYIDDQTLLRTHTSPVQLRVMERRKPPLRVISYGRCFRRDAVDRTHMHTFHQIEGFMVDRDIAFVHLKGVIERFARQLFGSSVRMRFRPDFFPFTEPSADGAISCILCDGKGCAVCSHTGWLEIFGCGMIHPQVLRNCAIDPEKWQGFAFGMGIERIAMIKYSIHDIRLFLENDLGFLSQFPY